MEINETLLNKYRKAEGKNIYEDFISKETLADNVKFGSRKVYISQSGNHEVWVLKKPFKRLSENNRMVFNYVSGKYAIEIKNRGLDNKFIISKNASSTTLHFNLGYRFKHQLTNADIVHTDDTGGYMVGYTFLKPSTEDGLIFYQDLYERRSDQSINYLGKYAVAEVALEYKNQICLLFDIFDYFKQDEEFGTQLMNNLFEWYFKEVEGIDEDVYDFLTQEKEIYESEKEYREKNALIVLCERLASKPLKAKEKRLSDAIDDMEYYKSQYETLVDKVTKMSDELEYLKNKSKEKNSIREGIEDLLRLDIVEDIKAKNEDILVISTGKIYAEANNKRYYLGKYDIEINFDTNCGSEFIRFFNREPAQRRYNWWSHTAGYRFGDCIDNRLGQHPHVSYNGSPCLGNARTPLVQCKNNGDIIGLVMTAISYLQSVNLGDIAGVYVTSWDEVDNEGNVIQKGYYYKNPPKDRKTYECDICCSTVIGQDSMFARREDGDNMDICSDCADKVLICAECGDYFEKGDGYTCDNCGQDFCSLGCLDRNGEALNDSICGDCADEVRLSNGDAIKCEICDEIVKVDNAYTREECGKSVCTNHVEFIDNKWLCTDCKHNQEDVLENY